MPQVSLTPQQQAQVDAANKAVAIAQDSYNSSKNESDAAYAFIKKQYSIFADSGCKYAFQSSFEDQINKFGALNPQSCGNAFKCGKEKCQQYVVQWNPHYHAWRSKEQNTNTAYQVLQGAKNKLNEVLDAISKDPTVAANASIINNQIQADKDKDKIKWIFFGLAALVIIVALILFSRRVITTA